MRADLAHSWAVTPAEGRDIQQRLVQHLERQDRFGRIETVAGVDVGFEDGGNITRAAIMVLDAQSLEPLAQTLARRATTLPYIPGLLSFRELPAVFDALEQLHTLPDLLLCDGHGMAHPRRMGIACHLGLLADIPSLGVGKSRLVGEHGPVPDQRGAWTPLTHHGETIGAVLRSRAGVKPVYVSPGHRIGLQSAIAWTMHCVTRYRLPETTRAADKLASRR